MEFLINYWYFLIAVIAILSISGYSVYVFVKRPTTEQINSVKEWLLYAVASAEKELGSGTGQIKLRYVYDMFIAKFPYLAKVISFESFSLLVDEALDKFKTMLSNNSKLQTYIQNTKEESK